MKRPEDINNSWAALLNIPNNQVDVAETARYQSVDMGPTVDGAQLAKAMGSMKKKKEGEPKKQTTVVTGGPKTKSLTTKDIETVGSPGGIGGPIQNAEVDYQQKMQELEEEMRLRGVMGGY